MMNRSSKEEDVDEDESVVLRERVDEGKNEDVDDDDLVSRFALWGTSREFNEELEIWIDKHCVVFENATGDISGEQDLRWGRAFRQYNDWLEEKLQDFCKREKVREIDVFDAMRGSLRKNKDSGAFFPIFIKNTDYEQFVFEMSERARELETLRRAKDARRQADRSRVLNISGEWYNDPTCLDTKILHSMMKMAGLPWVFRKLFTAIASTRNIRLVIEQTDEFIKLTSHFKFFGSAVTYLRWNEPTRVYNFWRKLVTCEASVDDDRVRMRMTDVDYYPAGSKVEHTWSLADGGERLVFVMGLDLPDGQKMRLPFNMRSTRSGK